MNLSRVCGRPYCTDSAHDVNRQRGTYGPYRLFYSILSIFPVLSFSLRLLCCSGTLWFVILDSINRTDLTKGWRNRPCAEPKSKKTEWECSAHDISQGWLLGEKLFFPLIIHCSERHQVSPCVCGCFPDSHSKCCTRQSNSTGFLISEELAQRSEICWVFLRQE